jgi:hypothetical protein
VRRVGQGRRRGRVGGVGLLYEEGLLVHRRPGPGRPAPDCVQIRTCSIPPLPICISFSFPSALHRFNGMRQTKPKQRRNEIKQHRFGDASSLDTGSIVSPLG